MSNKLKCEHDDCSRINCPATYSKQGPPPTQTDHFSRCNKECKPYLPYEKSNANGYSNINRFSLTEGQKVGIGIGVSVGIILLLPLLCYVCGCCKSIGTGSGGGDGGGGCDGGGGGGGDGGGCGGDGGC
jgi:hypothetical protein